MHAALSPALAEACLRWTEVDSHILSGLIEENLLIKIAIVQVGLF